MKKSPFFLRSFLAINLVCLLTLGVAAQGRRSGGRGGGGFRFSSPHNYVSIGNSYRGYNNFGFNYNHYPRYQYHSIYSSPYAYAHFGPAFGFRINVLPFGYYPFYIGNDPFYYYQGIYYRPYNNGGYQVVAPPLGAIVKHLPSGAKVTVINDEKYYELGGTFYQQETSAKNKVQYRVIGTDGVLNTVKPEQEESNDINTAPSTTPPVSSNDLKQSPVDNYAQGQKLNQLPANSKAVTINKQKLYLAPNGIYYQEEIDANNNLSYQNVGGDENNNGMQP